MSEEVIGFTLGHLAAAYVIGTAAGLWLFREWVKERIVTATLDSLVEQGYLYSWLDENGVTQITKWSDLGDVDPDRPPGPHVHEEETDLDVIDRLTPEEIEQILDELIKEEKKDSEEDDTP